MKAKTSTVDTAEIERFSRLAGEWWDERGPFAPLHRINALRIGWIVEQAEKHFKVDGGRWMVDGKNNNPLTTNHQPPTTGKTPLAEFSLLDVGCGGGLVCEPMTRLGANVTGIDASQENIEVAKLHAAQSGLGIDYRCATAETLAESASFDIVLALEIVEHVADVAAFVEATCRLVKPGGLIIYSTLNRTLKSFALGIVAAEYILKWIPRGTHQWEKFLKPSELAAHLRRNHVDITEMTGLTLNPLDGKWRLDPNDLGVNYFVAGKKSLS